MGGDTHLETGQLAFILQVWTSGIVHRSTVETGLLAHALMGSIAELYMRLYSRMHL